MPRSMRSRGAAAKGRKTLRNRRSPGLVQGTRELRPGADAELPVRALEVGLDRVDADEGLIGDRAVRQPVGGEPGDPQLGRRQRLGSTTHGDASQLGLRTARPGLGTGPEEEVARLLERAARLALLLQAPEDLPVGEQRPRALERHRAAFVRAERLRERLARELEIALGGMHETAATPADGEAPRNRRARGALLEASEQPPRAPDVADGKGGLDRVAVDPPDRRLAEVDAFEAFERLREQAV